MREDAIHTALAASVQEVLETMFFADACGWQPDAEPLSGLGAELTFEGDPPGSFLLLLDAPVARSAAADFLGEDPSCITTEQLDEVVGELANMICGSVLSRIESGATFHLSKPRAISGCGSASRPKAGSVTLVSGGVLKAELRLERQAWSGTDEPAS